MRLSTKARYGMRAMVELASQHDKGPMSIKEMAENQGLSVKYLENLVTSIRKNGLVRSIRGSRGGYVLTRPPEDIDLYEIYTALEGDDSIVACLDHPCCCDNSCGCATRKLWKELNAAYVDILKGRTLADLLEEAESADKVRIGRKNKTGTKRRKPCGKKTAKGN